LATILKKSPHRAKNQSFGRRERARVQFQLEYRPARKTLLMKIYVPSDINIPPNYESNKIFIKTHGVQENAL
jgi:hypothetical protein